VTDRGLRTIKSLRKLEYLWLSASQVSDHSIPFLEELPNLETINANGSDPLDPAFRKLQDALPNVQIEF
jgi:hypothetical protein